MKRPAEVRTPARTYALAAGDGAAAGGSASPVSFWRANLAAWTFIAFFGLASRLAAFSDVALAVTLTLVLEPIGFILTAAAYKFYLERTGDRRTVVAAWALACSASAGLLQMVIANALKDGLFPGIPDENIAANDAVPAVF